MRARLCVTTSQRCIKPRRFDSGMAQWCVGRVRRRGDLDPLPELRHLGRLRAGLPFWNWRARQTQKATGKRPRVVGGVDPVPRVLLSSRGSRSTSAELRQSRVPWPPVWHSTWEEAPDQYRSYRPHLLDSTGCDPPTPPMPARQSPPACLPACLLGDKLVVAAPPTPSTTD